MGAPETRSDQVMSDDGAAGTAAAERSRAYRAQKQQVASLEAELATAKAEARDARDETAAARAELASVQAEVADLRAQVAVASAVSAERLRQIEALRADLAEAHKAATSAGQEPKKRVRHYTSAERFDSDVLHQEVLQKWFKYADEHPNPVPPEERTRRVVREIIAAGKAKEAAGAQKATDATAATEVPDTTETPEVPVADAAAASDWRGHLRHRLGL